jgi:hypothetical protein
MITFNLVCSETNQAIEVARSVGVYVGGSLHGASLVGLFCVAHVQKTLCVIPETETVQSNYEFWNVENASTLYKKVTGKTPRGSINE